MMKYLSKIQQVKYRKALVYLTTTVLLYIFYILIFVRVKKILFKKLCFI